MNKYKYTALMVTFLYGFTVILMAGYMTKQQAVQATIQNHDEIPCISEFQAKLNRLEPNCPILEDGRLGPETQKKWDRIFCEQSALKTFKKGD